MSTVTFSADTGTSSTDLITKTASQTISGTLASNLVAGESVQVSIDNGVSWSTATSTTGAAAYSLSATLLGDNTLKVRVIDLAGNTGTATSRAYSLDTQAPSTIITSVSFSNDTGTSTTDFITNREFQVISGVLSSGLVAGERLWVATQSDGIFSDVTASVTGTTFTLPEAVLAGSNTFSLVVGDAAGNTGVQKDQIYTINASPPTNTVNTLTFSADTGTSSTDLITKTAAQTISGTLASNLSAGDLVKVSIDNGATWSTATTSTGSATYSLASQTLASSNNVLARVEDLAGNASTALTRAFILDQASPSAPTVTTLTTSTTTPSLSGSATLGAGEVLTVTVSGATYSVIPSAGAWSLNLATATPASGSLTPLTQGHAAYPVTATVTDLAGNSTSDVSTNELSVIAGPSQSVSIVSMTHDSGAADFITNDGAARTVSGTLSAGLTGNQLTQVSFDNGSTWSTATTTTTSWTINDSATHSGSWTLKARVTDTGLNVSGGEASQLVTYDVTAPDAATVDTLFTTNTLPTITGSATLVGGDVLTVSVSSATYSVIPSAGTWSLNLATATPTSGSLVALTQGHAAYPVTATVTDLAGNSINDVSTDELNVVAGPAQSVSIVSMTNDSGAADFVTNDGGARTTSGMLSAPLNDNQRTEISFDGGSTWAPASMVGSLLWTKTDTGTHNGSWTIKARVTDTLLAASGGVTTQAVTLDQTSPSAPAVNTLTTAATTPTLSGSATPGADEVLTVTVSGATYTVTPSAGSWSLNLATAIPASGSLTPMTQGHAAYPVTATITDLAGNSTSDGSTNELVILAPPSQSVSIVGMTHDSGASDFVTNDGAARTVSGTLSAVLTGDQRTQVSFDNGTTWSTASTTATSWTISDGATHSNSWTIKARVTDTTLQASGTQATQLVTYDAAPPTNTVHSLTLSADTGSSNTDFITRTAIQTISGTLSAPLASGEVVRISTDNGSGWLNAVATAGSANFSFECTLAGTNTILVRVDDTAGNAGIAYSQPYVIEVVTTDTSPGPTNFSPIVVAPALPPPPPPNHVHYLAIDTLKLGTIQSIPAVIMLAGGDPAANLPVADSSDQILPNVLLGKSSDISLVGGQGNDYFYLPIIGNYHIWGGGGIDNLVIPGNSASFSMLTMADGTTNLIGPTIWANLVGINSISFSDKNVYMDGKVNDQAADIKTVIVLDKPIYDATSSQANVFLGSSTIESLTLNVTAEKIKILNVTDGIYKITDTSNSIPHTITSVNVDRLVLADTKIALDMLDSAGEVTKLLGAVFGKDTITTHPDYIGIGLKLMDNGMSYPEIANYALKVKGYTTNDQLVNALWTNIFGTAPTPDQMKPYLSLLQSGAINFVAITLLAADSNENLSHIGFNKLIDTGVFYS